MLSKHKVYTKQPKCLNSTHTMVNSKEIKYYKILKWQKITK